MTEHSSRDTKFQTTRDQRTTSSSRTTGSNQRQRDHQSSRSQGKLSTVQGSSSSAVVLSTAQEDSAATPSKTAESRTCSSAYSRQANGLSTLVLPLLTVFVGICVVVVTALVAAMSTEAPMLAHAVCTSHDCMLHAQLLRMASNASVDPCDDFYAFSCGSWESHEKRSRIDDLVAEVSNVAIGSLRSKSRSSKKAAKLFGACTQPSKSDVESNLKLFKELRRNLSMFWPEAPPRGAATAHPMDMLLNLAINWRMGLLFQARILLSPASGTPVFVFTPGTLSSRWRPEDVMPESEAEYESYVRKHLEILNASTSFSISALKALQSHFVSMSLDVARGDPYHVPLNIASLAASWPWHDTWLLELINKHSKPYLFGADSPVVIGSKLFENIDVLFTKHSDRAIVEAISWMFIEEHLWIIAGRSDLRVGTSEKSGRLVERACLDYVSSSLGLLTAEDYVRNEYPARTRKRVNSLVGQITLTFYDSVESATWLDVDAKNAALAKIRKLKAQIWPATQFFDQNATKELYEKFPDMTGPFFGSFVQSLRTLRGLLTDAHFDDLYTMQIALPHGSFDFDYCFNQALVSMAVLKAPVYYFDGTDAMIYGGFGTLYAQEAAKTMDLLGRVIDADCQAYRKDWQRIYYSYKEKMACVYTKDTRVDLEVFPLVAGLEITYRTFLDALRRHSDSGLRLESLEQYTEKQLFFMTYCSALCSSHTDLDARERCNAPLKNFKAFAKAYNCSPDAPHEPPSHKCAVFTTQK
ncbi:hypothetical protein MRX96_011550 [Rhipicephalus microplus]